ncbi:MAG TPA: hypothetical protein VK666_22760 [Chryseolinea sp.]|nr:hypothetical protein [Chryseolinea sp.]
MKRASVILAVGLLGFMVIGADQRSSAPESKVAKKSCSGYTVIESTKGIDCNGDTIRLIRTAGFYQRVRDDDAI